MENFFSKALTPLMVAMFTIAILFNLYSNWEDNNYRAKSDYREAVDYINENAIPGTTLYTSAMEYAAFDAYTGLARVRRDFAFRRHNFELDSSFFSPGSTRIDVPAFFYHRDIESKDPLYYVKNIDSIRSDFYVVPLERNPRPKFRHIVADTGNQNAYQALAVRNIYYLLPKQLVANLRHPHLELREERLRDSIYYFISNAEYDTAQKALQMIELTYPLNVFVPAKSDSSGKIAIELLFGNKPNKNGCTFNNAQLQFFYNNRFVKETDIAQGPHYSEFILPKRFNRDQVNILSLVLSFGRSNQFSRELVSPNLCQLAIRGFSYTSVPDYS